VLEETKELLESSRSRVIPSVANIEMYDLSLYKIEVEQSKFQIGQPIRLTWKAPEYHGARDWIGIYQVKANKSTHVTSVSSRLLWYWTNKVVDENTNDALFPPETPTLTSGALEFKGATLPWKVGKYEFRYHHDGKHNVMARSIPFEIEAPVTPRVIDVSTTKETLLKLVQHILGNNPEIMPASADEGYVGMGESESKHLVYCIKLLYNVEFAWEVVNTDKCVTRLSKRVSKNKKMCFFFLIYSIFLYRFYMQEKHFPLLRLKHVAYQAHP
jgi:phosphatidylethanolamine N-methyltransferase